MDTKISKPVEFSTLIKFALPTIASMILMNLFGIVDGIFASRIISPLALAAVNIVFPFLTFVLSIGFMLGVGGNALVATKIGKGQIEEARSNFNLIVVVSFCTSVILALYGILFPRQLLGLLGANEEVFYMSYEYIRYILYFLPFILLGVVFQQFLMTEGKAHISTISFLIGGLVSVFLNWLLIYRWQMGLTGAALSTAIGYMVPSIIGILYFAFNKKGMLYISKTKLDMGVILKSSANGASEMVTMISVSISAIFINNILIGLGGAEAIAAVGIVFSTMNILSSFFIGYATGISPIISYNYGNNNTDNLSKAYQKSLIVIFGIAVFSIIAGWFLTSSFIRIYVEPNDSIYSIAYLGFRISISGFIFMGINVFSSAMFTALNNGKVSATIAFLRTLLFVIIYLLILPLFFGVIGVWIAMPLAELSTFFITVYLFKRMKKVYNYA